MLVLLIRPALYTVQYYKYGLVHSHHSGRIRLLFPEILPPIVEHHGDEEGGRYTEDNERQKNDTRTRSGFAALLSLEFQH